MILQWKELTLDVSFIRFKSCYASKKTGFTGSIFSDNTINVAFRKRDVQFIQNKVVAITQ
jgi:hypothetical protein